MWIWIVIALVVGVSGLSLYGNLVTRRDLTGGSPSYDSIVDYTGIGSQTELERLLGPPDVQGRYSLSRTEISRLPRRKWVHLFDSVCGDIGTAIVAVIAGVVFQHNQPLAWLMLSGAAIYTAIGYCIAVWIFSQHPRLRE